MEIKKPKGILYIVATPIGNLEDITFRAIKTLKQVDMIAAEDTRHSKKLLSHYGIGTKLISCHEHNEQSTAKQVLSCLKNGSDIALISDAGTPLISDPGYRVVQTALKEQIKTIAIPGCSAAVAGLSASGLETDSFLFLGFMPKKKAKLDKALEKIEKYPYTLIFYESPKRVKSLVKNISETLGNRKACLAREMTKIHEQYIRGTLMEIYEQLEQKKSVKGECSLFVQGFLQEKQPDSEQLEQIINKKLGTTDLKTADLARKIATQYNVSRKKVYEMIIKGC